VTTPNVTSPNVRILVPEVPLPPDAPKSQTPLAEAALAELLQGGRLGIRDMYKPAASPLPVITDAAQQAWFGQRNALSAGYPDDHAAATDWYVESWQRTNDRPAPEWVKAVTFSPACLAGRCWVCGWAPEACACGHHRAGGRAPYGPVKPADPLPAVAEFLGIAKPALVAAPEPEPAADEAAPVTDATAVLKDIADEQEAAKEPADATKVIAVTDAPTEAVPVVKPDGGDGSD
jgi:hypothetical protein